MFFYLSKAFYFLLHPFSWIILLLLGYIFTKHPIWKKRWKVSLIIVALFFSNTFIFKIFMHQWEEHSTPTQEIGTYDVAIVLGGMFEMDNDAERLTVRRGADRIWQALDLYHSKRVKKILISGDSGYITDRGLHEAEQTKEVLVGWGIPAEDILVEPYSRNTYENAVESVKILKEHELDKARLLLITSASHMKRAAACFTKQRVNFTPFSTDQYTGAKLSLHWDEYFVPSGGTLVNWFVLIKEWVGYLSYKIAGYI
ncbi:MAG: YdcF family protein [Crocinitomicaceae bacterium]|nr:YdcF family protein [Crocinitomicaceae bacterium]